jgi:hypothetical protein
LELLSSCIYRDIFQERQIKVVGLNFERGKSEMKGKVGREGKRFSERTRKFNKK